MTKAKIKLLEIENCLTLPVVDPRLETAMDQHAIDFLDWCVKQGKIKVYHNEAELKSMYQQFNKIGDGK